MLPSRVKSPWYFFNRKNNSEGKKHKIKAAHTAFWFYVVKQRILTTLIEYFNRKKKGC